MGLDYCRYRLPRGRIGVPRRVREVGGSGVRPIDCGRHTRGGTRIRTECDGIETSPILPEEEIELGHTNQVWFIG